MAHRERQGETFRLSDQVLKEDTAGKARLKVFGPHKGVRKADSGSQGSSRVRGEGSRLLDRPDVEVPIVQKFDIQRSRWSAVSNER